MEGLTATFHKFSRTSKIGVFRPHSPINGLKNIEANLGTNEYRRIKVGISNDKGIDTKDYVLGKLNQNEKRKLMPTIKMAADAVLESFHTPFPELMSKYNTRIKN